MEASGTTILRSNPIRKDGVIPAILNGVTAESVLIRRGGQIMARAPSTTSQPLRDTRPRKPSNQHEQRPSRELKPESREVHLSELSRFYCSDLA